MSYETYTAKMPWGESLTIRADLSQASAPIQYESPEVDDEENWVSTPYQTADARHRAHDAMMLVVGHLGGEWYRAPGDTRENSEIEAEISESIEVK